jgi:hypothetical protein
MTSGRFSLPWQVELEPEGLKVLDRNGQAAVYVYVETDQVS